MSQEKRKKRRKRKKKLKLAFFGFIFIYLLARSIPSLGDKTVLPEEFLVEDKINTEAIIIKKEKVYTADGEGKLKVLVKEGERVPVGTKIAELNQLSDTSTLKQRLNEIDKRIETLSQADTNDSANNSAENELEEDINNTIDDIQERINDGDYYEAIVLKDKLSTICKDNKDLTGEDKLIDYSLQSLKEQREEVVNQISNNTIDYYADKSGILSLKIDGYEGLYSILGESDYKYSEFEKIGDNNRTISDKDTIKVGDPIFKIIDNFEWYMLIKIENMKDINMYEIGDEITLSGGDIERELKGKIRKISKEGNKGTILCKFNDDFYYYYDKRHIEVDIIRNRYNTYKIPKKSVVEIDGTKGVYIKDINGIIRFRAVSILQEDDEYVYISVGDKNNKINIGKDKSVRTVGKFDEILLNPSKAKEGMIINWHKGVIKISIKENLNIIEDNIKEALIKSGRKDNNVKILAVTKTVDVDRINEALELGLKDIGENRPQELLKKYDIIGNKANFHMIGHLQTNKVKYIIDKVCLIHSLDRMSLAEELQKRASMNDIVIDTLVEVNVAEEDSKSGLKVKDVIPFIQKVSEFKNIRIKGLMTIAPFVEDPEDVRWVFRDLRKLSQEVANRKFTNVEMKILSMGMTNDYKVAIEEGSNLVRIGTGLFGKRK